MRTLKLLHHLIITLMQMMPGLKSSPGFLQKRSLHLNPAVAKCFTVFFMILLFSSSNVFAQTESMDTTRWISPDIPRGTEARPVAGRPAAQFQTLAVPSSANPDIPQSLLCQDLKVVFVLDESGSITGSEITSVENGALALANALLNSGATLQLVEFNTTSSIVNLGVTQVNSTYISRLTSYLGAGYNGQNYNPVSSGSCTGWTNWQDAMDDVATLNADLIIFFTDGNPTAYNVASGGNCSGNTVNAGNSTTISLDNAVTQANIVKGQGKHIFVVGVGNSNEINLDNIKAISGNDAFGPGHDILTADYTTPPFEALATNLTAAVNAICGTELLVDKTASNSGVCSGQTVTFTNTVTNTGGDFNFTALSVVAKDVYPNGYSNLQFVPSAPAGASISGNTVTYNIGDMAADQSVTYQIKATVLVPVPVKNYNNVISATAFNANEVRDSVSVLSGFATAEIDTTSCVPVVINGITYSSTNTYTQTLVSAAGCDSVLTIKLTIAAPTTSTETVIQCDSYTWPLNGTTYTESGTYTSSLTSAAGCVHTTTLNLTINKSTSNTTTVIECDSYTWGVNGVTYTESGTYSVTSANAAGCTHTETLELTINKSTSNTVEAAACDSYFWAESGETYTQSGTYTVTSTNAAGCPHTETLILTINESTSNVTTAAACDSYVWSVNGNTYTESGLYTSVSVNAAGCPYTEALSLTINHSTENTASETACDSYTWAADGNTYTESGTYTATSTNAEGCTHTETLVLTINKSTSNTVTEIACDSYTWGVNGVTYTESGTYSVNSTNETGCPHTEILELTINKSTSNSTPVTACDNYTWAVNGVTYTESGTYSVNSTNETGCLHTETLVLTINKSTSHTTTVGACGSYTWAVNGITYTTGGTYNVTSTNAAGCPHTEILVLTIGDGSSNSTPVTACDSYTWSVNGVTYTESGTYSVTSTNQAGCPHTETLVLTINKSTTNSTSVTVCDSYAWGVNGVTYTESGTYSVTSTNSAGCPHTETLVLTINKTTTNSTPVNACDSYTWPVNGVTYTAGGTYSVTSTNQAGCPHTETLVLTINKSTSNTTTIGACGSYTWAVNGVTYTTGGTYNVTSTNAAGCPHTETLVLTIGDGSSNSTPVTACDSYTWGVNGVTYTESGTYSVTSTNQAGCPHTETLVLTINKSTSNSTPVTACDSYTWGVNGVTYTESGTYSVTSTNDAGCPHTETLVLTINKTTTNSTPVTACDSYTWPVNGVTYTTGGTYSVTSTNQAGCPHTETLVLTINKSTSNTTTIGACGSYTWAVNGVTYTTGGTYTVISTNAAGCPHIERLVLTIGSGSSNTTPVTACNSYTWPVNGATYTTGGTYSVTSTNQAGCPHTEILVLTINKSTSHSTPVTACNSYTWPVNGVTYTTGGTYSVTSTNQAGCPHTETLVLTINKSTSNSTTVTACDSYKWAVNGVTYTVSGTYSVTSANAAGCPHTETLALKINKSTSNTTTTSACGSYTWSVNGTTYTKSGTYTVTSTNAAGCPHTEKLVLTINTGTSTTTTKAACDSYTWPVNGVTYTQSGTYTVTVPGTYGCSSVQKLVLTINKSSYKTTTITACNSYKWSVTGTTYTQSGTYFHYATTAAGCTCTEKLVLTISKTPVVGAISGPVKVCRNQPGVQYSVAAVSNATSYTWVLPSGVTGTSTSNVITVVFGTSFTGGIIKVRANNACGSCAYSQISVTAVTAVPSVCGNITGSRVFCATGNLNYSIAAVANATSYLWTVTGTGLSIVSGQGTTGITVTATSAFVSGSISVKAINCFGSCTPVTIAVSASRIPAKPGPISGPAAGLCKKSNITYSVPAVPGATSYTWTVPAGATIVSGAGTNTIKVTFGPTLTGAGSIGVSANNACGSSAACSLAVTMVPAMPVASSGSLSVSKTQSAVVYSVVAVPDATSYTWTISGGAKFTGSTTGNSVTVNFNTATSTTAVITAKANNACGSSATGSATIAVSLGTTRGYARGVNGSTLIDEMTTKASNYVVYPNPSNGQFNVSFNTQKMDKVAMVVMDVAGRVVYNAVNTYGEGPQLSKINISKLAKGTYFVRIVKNTEQEKVIKVFVE